jgi:hypothetical protein|tara:strand:+ start:1415 stop:1666 length:252 start_codon:yes stop_codon:yes gene_type:complete
MWGKSMVKPTDKELIKFNKKLWELIDEHSPKEDRSSHSLMISGCLLNACLKSYVTTLGKEPTIAMFEMAIDQLTMGPDTRILH